VLLSFGLRLWRLDVQSLRGDEALSVIYAAKPWSEIVRITRFVSGHPPLYYFVLHLWEWMTGNSVFAARYLSVWWGTLAVPLAYALGAALFGRWTARAAAGLVALNTFYVWHAQDARVYALFITASMLASLALWYALKAPTRWRWLVYALCGVLVVYAHYFGALTIAAHAAFYAYDRVRRRARWLGGSIAFLVVGASIVPWLWLARHVVLGQHGPGGHSLTLWRTAQQCLLTFGVGYWRESWGRGLATVVLGGLAAFGAASALRRNSYGALFVGLCALMPTLGLYALSRGRPIFRERYVAAAAPGYALLLGEGLAGLRRATLGRTAGRGAALALAAAVVSLNGCALLYHYWDERYAKSPEWREAAAFIQAHRRERDTVILNHQDQAFLYHYGQIGVQVLPSADAPDPGATERTLSDMASWGGRVWLVPDTAGVWDTGGLVRAWLDRECEPVARWSWRGVDVLLYHTPSLVEQEVEPIDARFGEAIDLLGYVLRDEGGKAVTARTVEPGGVVRFTLYWQARAPIERDYVVFAHVLDEQGRIRGQQDNQPRGGTFPTRAWTPGEWVVDVYEVVLDASVSDGVGVLEVGMYDAETGVRLPVAGHHADRDQRRVVLPARVVIE